MQKHDHHHHHHHHHDVKGKKLLWVTILNLAITVVQVVGGIVSNSLSLLSDALHNLGDSSAIFIAFLAGKRSHKEANEQKTFGYKRIEILAALFNGVVLIGICLYLFIEAYERFLHPEPIKGKIMFIVASFGLLANLISVVVLNKDKNDNLNIRAAYLHLLGDTFSSVAVIVGGLAIWKFGVFWIDPLITVLVGLYIIYHTWDVVKETVDILMQSTPANIDLSKIKNEVEKIEEIDNIHHIHVWKLDDTQIHLEAHINLAKNITMQQLMEVRAQAEEVLHQKFGIAHITLQAGYECCGTNPDLLAH
ncbi:cation diffusion facilitator family transporter [uncultured Draconibacterium sp.]|uniref:cation diffusion facilitator family transporter n=1 Tax=uncultured Draconibacterium sp. TaxID=1573823 RepID=UPI0025F58FE4|nr:cation diffusion facilitator family transporter [uncultured Draconibacterium sp.]